jgi:Phage Tail Collar Domain
MTAYNVVSPGAMVAGQPEDISIVLANFNAIANVINGNIDNSNIAPGAAIDAGKIAGGTGGSGTSPPGVVSPFAGTSVPSGYLWCDGGSYDRTTYANLFAVIGVAYGAVDGSHFNVPDIRGRFVVGYSGPGGASQSSSVGLTDGLALNARTTYHVHSHTLSLPGHGHSFSDPGHSHGVSDPSHVHTLYDFVVNFGGTGQGMTYGAPGATFERPSVITGMDAAFTGISIAGAGTGASVGGITSVPGINGGVGIGSAVDGPAWISLTYIIKT